MATINQKRLETCIEDTIAGASILGVESYGNVFKESLRNPSSGPFSSRGIVLCYGETEGIATLIDSYRTLREKSTPWDFARMVSEGLQEFSAPFPEGQHNLTYSHFLLHGLRGLTASEVRDKIIDNGRIIHESTVESNAAFSGHAPRWEAPHSGYYFTLRKGIGDDFHGVSYQLFSEKGRAEDFIAKAGFLIDRTNTTAYLINLQGQRPPERNAPKAEAKARRRSFGQRTDEFGMDPRVYVLNSARDYLRQLDLTDLKAIKPEFHPMYIGGHPGFTGRYEGILHAAGLSGYDGCYLTQKLKA